MVAKYEDEEPAVQNFLYVPFSLVTHATIQIDTQTLWKWIN